MAVSIKSVSPEMVGKPSVKLTGKDATDVIGSKKSNELVIGLSGPVGCGINNVIPILERALKHHGYQEIVLVKISQLFADISTRKGIQAPEGPTTSSDEYNRICGLQDLGNSLREAMGGDLAGQAAIENIAVYREQHHPNEPGAAVKTYRVAYIVDQLKHPSEVALLRDVYGDMFFLLGVLSGYERRKRNLKQKMPVELAEKLIERDKSESNKKGQQLEKTLKLADFFIRNSHDNETQLSPHVDRFIDLIHGKHGMAPSPQERGMFAAYTASLKSACLSRQVGAAILDGHANILATGCNDVPRAGGGLYEFDGSEDHRCVYLAQGVCFNHEKKDALSNEIKTLLVSEFGINISVAESYAKVIREKSGLRDLIEFSRAVHAEMDAIVTVARTGGVSTKGGVLFTTTYPCHNCARHIVAAGIRAVYFIEPYEKSLADELHSDAIDHDPGEEPAWNDLGTFKKVAFLHFEGVSPNKFVDFFHSSRDRKDGSGKAIKSDDFVAPQKKSIFSEDYMTLEKRVISYLNVMAPSEVENRE